MHLFVTLPAIVFLVGADAPADAVKKDLALLDGEWHIVSAERDGQALPENLVQTGKRVARDGETTVTFGDMVFMKAKVTIDPSKKPKTIDYDVQEGVTKGKKLLGIYEIDGDTVKFCFAAPDKDRPTEFKSKDGSGHTLSVWKRKKE